MGGPRGRAHLIPGFIRPYSRAYPRNPREQPVRTGALADCGHPSMSYTAAGPRKGRSCVIGRRPPERRSSIQTAPAASAGQCGKRSGRLRRGVSSAGQSGKRSGLRRDPEWRAPAVQALNKSIPTRRLPGPAGVANAGLCTDCR